MNGSGELLIAVEHDVDVCEGDVGEPLAFNPDFSTTGFDVAAYIFSISVLDLMTTRIVVALVVMAGVAGRIAACSSGLSSLIDIAVPPFRAFGSTVIDGCSLIERFGNFGVDE